MTGWSPEGGDAATLRKKLLLQGSYVLQARLSGLQNGQANETKSVSRVV